MGFGVGAEWVLEQEQDKFWSRSRMGLGAGAEWVLEQEQNGYYSSWVA